MCWAKDATTVTYQELIDHDIIDFKETLAGAGIGLALVLGGCAVTGDVEKSETAEVAIQKAEAAVDMAALEAVLAAQPG